jgi:glycine/D-amino acid oxidase-like deaminating enzyme
MSDKAKLFAGAGVMGVSAALAAKKNHPDYKIYLIIDSQQSIEPASEDSCKVLRAQYKEEAYAKLAAKAISLFPSDHVHPSGWITLHPSAEEQSIPAGLQMSKEDFLDRFPGARLDNIHKISQDLNVSWIEASKARQVALDLAKISGVILIEGQVADLLWDSPDGLTCVGVKLRSGQEIHASSVLLAMGHETAAFLEQCKLPDMGGKRAGISLLSIQLSDDQYKKYRRMPILRVSGIGKLAFPYYPISAHHPRPDISP